MVLLRVPRGFSDTMLWPEFLEMDLAPCAYLQDATTRIIRGAAHADTSEVEGVAASLSGR